MIGVFLVLIVLVGFGAYYLGKNQSITQNSQMASVINATGINVASLSGNTGSGPSDDIGTKWQCWFYFWGSWVDSGTPAGHWCVYLIGKPMPTGAFLSTVLATGGDTSSTAKPASANTTASAKCVGYWCISKEVTSPTSASDPNGINLAREQCTDVGGKVIAAPGLEPICAVQEDAMNSYLTTKFGSYSNAYLSSSSGISNTAKLNAAINSALGKGLFDTGTTDATTANTDATASATATSTPSILTTFKQLILGQFKSPVTGGGENVTAVANTSTTPDFKWICQGIQGCWCETNSGAMAGTTRQVDEKACLAPLIMKSTQSLTK